jgi:hypothetical protein
MLPDIHKAVQTLEQDRGVLLETSQAAAGTPETTLLGTAAQGTRFEGVFSCLTLPAQQGKCRILEVPDPGQPLHTVMKVLPPA